MRCYYTYIHLTDVGRVFYVGKGRGKRAWMLRRSAKHQRISSREGYNVEILFTSESEAEVLAYEIQLIEFFGTYTTDFSDLTDVCNFTIGGDGTSGRVCSQETKLKTSLANKGQIPWSKGKPSPLKGVKARRPRSIAARQKISAARKGKPSRLRGVPKSDATRAKMSIARRKREELRKADCLNSK